MLGDPAVTKDVAITVLAVAGALEARAPMTLTIALTNPSYMPAGHSSLPVLRVNTGGTPVVTKGVGIASTVTLVSADGQTSFIPGTASSDNTATISVRGNSTSTLPKLPYKLKFNTSMDLLTKLGLDCGYVTSSGPVCDKSKTYVLLANYLDKTLLRNWSASALANKIPFGGDYLDASPGYANPSGTSTPMPWAAHSVFVEMYLNGEYEGVFQLSEDIRVDSHRVNIKEMDETDVAAKAVTGGYIMDFDQYQDATTVLTTPLGRKVSLDTPDSDPVIPAQVSYINDYVASAEEALFSAEYTDSATGWPAYFDTASAVNFYIVNDLMANYDTGLFNSAYFYKDRNNPLLYMGPIWDFDVSSGNTALLTTLSPSANWMQSHAYWYARLFSDPVFYGKVVKQWNALKKNGVFDTWFNSIVAKGQDLQAAQTNEVERWPAFGIPYVVNTGIRPSYAGEVQYMVDWVKLRMDFLDAEFNPRPTTGVSLSSTSTVFQRIRPLL